MAEPLKLDQNLESKEQGHSSAEGSGIAPTLRSDAYRVLRVWPALLLIVAMLIARSLPGLIENGPANLWMAAAFGPLLGSFLILLWWLALSRARWFERGFGLLAVVVGLVLMVPMMDSTMKGSGTIVVTIPIGMAAFGIGAICVGRMRTFKRTLVVALMAWLGFGFSLALRTPGMWGDDYTMELEWRWKPTPEDLLLAEKSTALDMVPTPVAKAEWFSGLSDPEWSGFRGADRTGRAQGTRVSRDWNTKPPKELWKIAVGPGWSSFVVAGDLLFTQEQRGPSEAVVCYQANTGEQVWEQSLESRFEEALGGPGPRATPTLSGDGLYAMGAEGWLLRLDPRTGEVIWKQDLRVCADCNPPMWGFCGSPLVVDSHVIVHAGGGGDKGILAFDTDSGELKWSNRSGQHSYSSPQLANLNGTPVVMMLTNQGIDLLDPATGREKLNYVWPHQGYRSVQPQVLDGASILLPTGMGTGTRRIEVDFEQQPWAGREVWTSRRLKADFNDLVIHEGHAYGFDGAIFSCVDLQTGELKWRGGRYGKGQVVLLEDSGLLLVAGERGRVFLLKADPAELIELGSFQAIEGKTWNHPVVVGDRLYLRNAQQAACYQFEND